MEIPKEVVTAIIASTGVLVSVCISLTISKRMIAVELRKLRMQIQQTYASKLLESRIAVYPELYSYLSNFIKELQYHSITKDQIEDFLAKIDKWDSRNSIFFGGKTTNICYAFRRTLARLLKDSEEELSKRLLSQGFVSELKRNIETLGWH